MLSFNEYTVVLHLSESFYSFCRCSFVFFSLEVAPFVTVHPESKMRMPGQSVTFCCEGEGNPPPEIEW